MKPKIIGITRNGLPVYEAGHSHRPDLNEEVISRIDFKGGFMIVTVDLGREIGLDHCVETSDKDKIAFAIRGNRNGKTRFVLNKTGKPTTQATAILCTGGPEDGELNGKTLLVTLFEGALAPKEPFDKFRDESEKLESEKFWASHALVPTEEERKIINESQTN